MKTIIAILLCIIFMMWTNYNYDISEADIKWLLVGASMCLVIGTAAVWDFFTSKK